MQGRHEGTQGQRHASMPDQFRSSTNDPMETRSGASEAPAARMEGVLKLVVQQGVTEELTPEKAVNEHAHPAQSHPFARLMYAQRLCGNVTNSLP